jgi:hypothetical protein
MNKVLCALKQALHACANGRILLLLFTPFVLTLIIGFILFFTFGTWWIANASGGVEHSWLMQYLSQKWQFINGGSSDSPVASISYFVVFLIAVLVIIPLSYLLSVLLVSLVLLPYILKILEENNFPGIEKKRGGTISYSLWNTLKVSVIYLGALAFTLPLWFFPGIAVALPILLSSYLNKNIFVYDVLQDYASVEERQRIEKENWGLLYTLGIILGVINYIPLAFVVAPTFAGLAYSYFCLNALKDLRENTTDQLLKE